MMSTPSPTTSRIVRTRSTLCCMPAAPSAGSPAEAHLHRAIALVLVLLRLRRELVERLAVEAARVDRNRPLRAAAEQLEHRLLRRLAEDVPQRDVHGADRHHPDALPPERHRLSIHVLPEELDVERVLADEQRRQVEIDRLLRQPRRQRGVADADVAGVREDLDDQPAVKAEAGHRVGRQRQQVHRVRAEVRLRRHGRAAPFDDARADFGDFHEAAPQVRIRRNREQDHDERGDVQHADDREHRLDSRTRDRAAGRRAGSSAGRPSRRQSRRGRRRRRRCGDRRDRSARSSRAWTTTAGRRTRG